MTTLNLNLLLGSYSQGLLVQKALANRCQASGSSATSESQAQNSLEIQALQDDQIKKVEAIGQDEQESNSNLLTEKRKSVLERFSESLNEQISQSKKFDPVAASNALEQIVSEAADIGQTLGQAKANEFMNKVLVAVDGEADPEAIQLAVESFFASAADSSLANPTAYQKLEQAKGTFSKLLDGSEEAEPTEAASQADLSSSAQRLHYKSYVSGIRPGPQTRPFIQSPIGNLFSAVA
jgi:Spy/CpxP family protein refolding chaperone